MAKNGLGIDIRGVDDIDLYLSYGDEKQSTGDSIVRVLFHEAGALWWAPDRGYHLARHLHGFFNKDQIQENVKSQIEADERVDSCTVTVEEFGRECRIKIEATLIQNAGAVEYTVSVSELGVILQDNNTV